MLSINTELIIITTDLLFVTAGIKKFPPWDYKIPTLGLKQSQGGEFCVGAGAIAICTRFMTFEENISKNAWVFPKN